MNVYDMAHNLAKAIKESQEFKDYTVQKDIISENQELDSMIKDFQGKQMELQLKQMSGEELGPEAMSTIQSLSQIIMTNPQAAQYMQAEMRFAIMMNDVYKILGDAMGTEMPGLQGK